MSTPSSGPSIADLLAAVKATPNLDPKFKGVTDTIKAFSDLLVVLSEQATEQAEKNLVLGKSVQKLTRYIFGFTIIMAILGAGQFFFAYKSFHLAKNTPTAAYDPSTGSEQKNREGNK